MIDAFRLSELNAGVWRRGDWVSVYEDRRLSPAEILLLLRHREPLSGRVLELGPGAGRVTAYLAELASELTALEISPDMAEACRRRVPSATVEVRDMQDLGGIAGGSLEAVVGTCNVIDVLDDGERRALLAELHRILVPGGVLLFSSHNRDHRARRPWEPRDWRNPKALAGDVVRLRDGVRNHRRLHRFERDSDDYTLRNDEAHSFSMILYAIGAAAQQRQLTEAGFTLELCLTDDGEPVDPGGAPDRSPYLHYAARCSSAS
ncbi:class I SAM-dependent methyltransferase [Baekduia soli]|uniref:Class I SAM-dependent methyltransferase n=1 Tax=Baekduia soli TaxID=496014 RepID=A0A5B8U7T6_9ACTN|nr:class I SAM-dependent methyltransferase [Baekduia soli]QEC49017.1 class I SAM-dependent methyltransferase [Baekduia soli]